MSCPIAASRNSAKPSAARKHWQAKEAKAQPPACCARPNTEDFARRRLDRRSRPQRHDNRCDVVVERPQHQAWAHRVDERLLIARNVDEPGRNLTPHGKFTQSSHERRRIGSMTCVRRRLGAINQQHAEARAKPGCRQRHQLSQIEHTLAEERSRKAFDFLRVDRSQMRRIGLAKVILTRHRFGRGKERSS